VTKQSSCFAAGSGPRVSGTGCNINKNGHREAEPVEGVVIYDFPLLLILKPNFLNPYLRRRLPHLLIPYTLIFLAPPGERIEVRGTVLRTCK